MKKTLNLIIILTCFQFSLFAQSTELLELWQKKDWNTLITASSQQIQANKSNYQAYYWKQYALLEQGKNADAIEVLKAAFKSCENKLEIRSELANLYFLQGMYLQAKTELDELLKEQRPHFRTFEQRVLIHEFSKERVAAINLLHRGKNNDASHIFYWIHLGENYKQLGEYDDAIKFYEMAMDMNPLDYETNSKLARVYLKVDPEAALDICDLVLEKDSTNIRFIQIAASAHIKLDEEIEALNQYIKALSLGDSTINTMRNAGILFQKFKKSDIALKLLNKSYQIDSTDVKVVFYLAMAETHLFNPDKGLELFDESLKLMQPDSSILSIIHKEKAIIYADKKQHQEALDNYLIAHKFNPKKKFYLYLIAEQYDALNKKKEALEYYQKVLDTIDEKKGLDLLTASIRDYSESRISKLKEDLFMEK
ncbi:tetratricopeptide repeat protein [Ancylomarina sp.]|uniref:tetratricopeptide repeat protein n=1 Tax=Ancylomarina sp. TaxID=1970196 RepID=UPI003568FAE1